MKFSIFLPVRNGWPYINECVASILNQTYPYFELHVLDNQSSDNTTHWLNELTDNRVHLWSSSESLPIAESWARINNIAKQEYMTLIGHDDLFDADFLAVTEELIRQHPGASLYQTGSRFINAQGKIIRSCRPVPNQETAADYLEARLSFQRDVFGTGYVMRSIDYENVGGIPAFEKLFFADDALWMMLSKKSYKAAISRETFSVRIHSESESASLPSAWSSILKGLNQFTEFLQNFAQEDNACLPVLASLAPSFLLNRHRAIYLYALLDACNRNSKLDPAILDQIESSLLVNAPEIAPRLRHSLKIKLLEFANRSPFRHQVSHLWDAYYRLQTKS